MRRFASLAVTTLALTGCYSVTPLATMNPAPGTRLALAINDGGRVALGGAMGPSIEKVEGKLVSKQDTTYVLSVIGVDYLNGTFQKWQGETVRINSGMVSGFYTKRFSTVRTALLVAGAAAAALMVTHGPIGKSSPSDPAPGDPPSNEARYPIRIRLRP